jgi:hypothetical protein
MLRVRRPSLVQSQVAVASQPLFKLAFITLAAINLFMLTSAAAFYLLLNKH